MNEHSSQGQDREGRHRKERDRKREKKRRSKKWKTVMQKEEADAGPGRKGYLENAFGKTDRVLLKNRRVIGLLFEFGWQVIDVFDPDQYIRTSFVQRVRCSQLEHVLKQREQKSKERKENVTV